jgi:2-oxoglutarate ferredoxin oxidoreductase subunit beta
MLEENGSHGGNGAVAPATGSQPPRAANGNGAPARTLGKSDFQSEQETRWCPGCGDYAVLAAVQAFMPELGIPPERIVFVSGIGCAGRFSYYMDTYGMHGIHGRAPALATGLAAARDDLSIWVVSGDGDALSIGGNHLIHALRRNVPVKILLFNNQIYGLTKGQASPTSDIGLITKSTPFGAEDAPFNPVSLALGAEASFVARTIDTDKQHLPAVLRAAAEHPGAALVEIYQNCPVFNDGAFGALTEKGTREHNLIRLEHGQPIRFGPDGEHGVVRGDDGQLQIARVGDDGEDGVDEGALVVHDAHCADPSLAFALSRLSAGPAHPTPIGIFRSVPRPVWGAERGRELAAARAGFGEAELEGLLQSGDTWTVA